MNTLPTIHKRPSSQGFSMLEIIATVAVAGILASLALTVMSSTQSNVKKAKLSSDVQKLNSVVSVYLGEGGSLTGITDPQAVIDQLKTVRSATDIKQNVGVMTGRGVDVRLMAVMQSSAEANSTSPRVLWDSTNKKFYTSTTSGTTGVSQLILDDSLLINSYGTDANRAQSKEKYNAVDGWVWANGNYAGVTPINPLDVTTTISTVSYDPTAIVTGSGGGGTTVTTLPAPYISPAAGSFVLASFPTAATVTAGTGIPTSGSALNYNVTHANGTSTGWAIYTGAISITYGDTVQAKNITTNSTLYADSAVTSATYLLIPTPLPLPVISPAGGLYLASAWPDATISSNGAVAGSSKISYNITHTDGSSTGWLDYSTALTIFYGDTVTAKNVALDTTMYANSATVTATYNFTGSTKLPPPLFTDTYDSAGKHIVKIDPDNSQITAPAGYRIYYTTNGVDPGVSSTENQVTGTLYDPTKGVAVPATTADKTFQVTARVYPPTADKTHWDTSAPNDIDINLDTVAGPGVAGGMIDVDTSHLLYAVGKGTTDGHVHAYDDKYNVDNVNMMALADTKLRNIQAVIPSGTYFKLIISNSNLSPGGRIVINKTYNAADPSTYTMMSTYANIPIASLPVYTINGAAGSTKLTTLKANFNTDTLSVGGLVGTVTGAVRANIAGPNGEGRDGALTIQAVKCNADGSTAFTTNLGQSNGGVQGFATSGLLYECTLFWHWKGGAY